MIADRRTFLGGAAAMLAGPARAVVTREDDVLLFAYFTAEDGARGGLRLAASDDGLRFRPLRGGASLLKPNVGGGLMRDPCLFRGPNPRDPYHLVWTTGWTGTDLGHATSHDLVRWSAQRALPVMTAVQGTRNVWAPEGIWDTERGRFVLFWSSTVTGMFDDVAGRSEDRYNHRLWYTTTRDFKAFDRPRVLLDPGFSIIDGTFLRAQDGTLRLIVKDERLVPERKHLLIATAASPTGPFGPLSPPISRDWVEGPAAVLRGDEATIYFDVYRDHRYGAIRSRDLVRWSEVTDRLSMPEGARHGTIVPVPRAIIERIEAGRGAE